MARCERNSMTNARACATVCLMRGRLQNRLVFLFTLVALFGAACTTTPVDSQRDGTVGTPPPQRAMRIGTYNIHYDQFGITGRRSWDVRRTGVATMIRRHAPDIVMLQEVTTWDGSYLLPARQIPDLEDLLPEYAFVGASPRDKIESSNPILYREDRFHAEETGVLYFTDDPDVPYSYGSGTWSGTWSPRFCRWARLRDPSTEQAVYLFNVHYHPYLLRSKREASRILVERVEDIAGDAPYVIAGDFNSLPGSAQVRIIEELLPVHDVLNGARRGSFHGYTGIPPWPRVDYIFASQHFTIHHAELARDRYNGTYASDHYPLFATLELNGRTAP